ncbi:hypothetical protein MasN3_10930 [Massilia varians]|uniref:Tle cognate immunity protein 4 C-terminal domain-containing protein n=1 Tax=Massilia varians TaxID=457921 RepID=A0ABM8C366_9BURK|nr:T6SS immunity protein Tli4 family protein [Massilia varians]BDT57599.1 hypothetical protein MasN3_10930 [Massilia varians]
MKPIFKKKWVIALAVAVAALTGTWAVGAVQDLYKVGKMTEKMKTVCIGRMLIDLPQETEFNVFLGSVRAFSISADPESAEAFDARMTQREAEIRAKPDWNEGNKNLELVREVKTENGLKGKIFMHGRRVFDGWQLNGDKRERYHFEDLTLEAHLHGNGISVEVSGDEFLPEALENLIKLVTQIVVNPDNRIPTEPGFCLDRVYVREPLEAAYGERVVVMAGLPSHPDIDIKFDTTAGLDPVDKGLLERAAASHARAGPLISARFTNLRAAPRTIGGLTGDELVERVIEENFAIVYGFRWEVIGTEDNVYVPTVELTMKTGSGEHEPVRSSLSEPAAIALWDKISSSIRIRLRRRQSSVRSSPHLRPSAPIRLRATLVPKRVGGSAATAATARRCMAANGSTSARANACRRHCCSHSRPCGTGCAACNRATRPMTRRLGDWWTREAAGGLRRPSRWPKPHPPRQPQPARQQREQARSSRLR